MLSLHRFQNSYVPVLLYPAEQPSLRLVEGTSKDGLHVNRPLAGRVKAMCAAPEGAKEREPRKRKRRADERPERDGGAPAKRQVRDEVNVFVPRVKGSAMT